MCSSSAPRVPKPPPPPIDASLLDAKRRQREQSKARLGLGSTLLTGGQGVLAPAATESVTLLGQ